MPGEVENIVARYERRKRRGADTSSLRSLADVMMKQEKERALWRWIRECHVAPLPDMRLLEVGCGQGANLLHFLSLGFRPDNMIGNELLPERARAARSVLPRGLTILDGDALVLDLPESSFDIVFQSTVFTSILDAAFQEGLARRMWNWAAPGGGVLWYDFIYDNPRNPDVAGVPVRRIRKLFPQGRLKYWRLTLAPPIARIVSRFHPALYTLFGQVPMLRTHVLCWIRKD